MAADQVRIDPDALRKLGGKLDEIVAIVGKTATSTSSRAYEVSAGEDGAPWGTGEIGDAFVTEYSKSAAKAIEVLFGLYADLKELITAFGATADKYDNVEATNSAIT